MNDPTTTGELLTAITAEGSDADLDDLRQAIGLDEVTFRRWLNKPLKGSPNPDMIAEVRGKLGHVAQVFLIDEHVRSPWSDDDNDERRH